MKFKVCKVFTEDDFDKRKQLNELHRYSALIQKLDNHLLQSQFKYNKCWQHKCTTMDADFFFGWNKV